jgi:hypothetical protein
MHPWFRSVIPSSASSQAAHLSEVELARLALMEEVQKQFREELTLTRRVQEQHSVSLDVVQGCVNKINDNVNCNTAAIMGEVKGLQAGAKALQDQNALMSTQNALMSTQLSDLTTLGASLNSNFAIIARVVDNQTKLLAAATGDTSSLLSSSPATPLSAMSSPSSTL